MYIGHKARKCDHSFNQIRHKPVSLDSQIVDFNLCNTYSVAADKIKEWVYVFFCYTPGIYADGYIVFAFPFVRSSVRMFVCSFVRSFVSSFVIPERSWNLCQSFC